MSTHTPGPWTITGEGETYAIRDTETDVVIAEVPCTTTTPDEHMGSTEYLNARLIAAAPDLLDVARMLIQANDEGGNFTLGDAVIRARAVIARAEGK